MKKRIILAFFIILFSLTSFGQDNEDFISEMNFEIGAGFFTTEGGGLLLKWWNGNNGFGLSFLPYADFELGEGFIMLGFEYDYRLISYKTTAPYLYIGTNGFYSIEENIVEIDFGIGFGFQWIISKHLDIQTHIGFGFYDFSKLNFAGGLSLFYWF